MKLANNFFRGIFSSKTGRYIFFK